MDKENAFKKVLQLCRQKQFKGAIDIVLDNELTDGEVNSKWVMNIIVACCRAVTSCTTADGVLEEDLYSLLTHIISQVTDLNESDLLSYLKSLFHILNFFLKKECYQVIVKMESILVPSFLPTSLPKEHNHVYQSCAGLLHNFIMKKNNNFKILFEMCNIMSKMYKAASNIPSLLTMSFNCGTVLSNLSCPQSLQEQYFFNVLDLIKSDTTKVNVEEDFKSFLLYFTMIYYNSIKLFDFENTAKFYEKSVAIGSKIFNREDCVNVLTLLKFPLVLSPWKCEKLESLLICKRSLSYIESNTLKQLIGNKLCNFLYIIVCEYYKSGNGGTEWCKLSETCRMEFINFIYEISRLELSTKYSCPCKCLVKTNVYKALSYSQFIGILIEICVCHKQAFPSYNKEGANLLAKFCHYVDQLKNYNCEKWKQAWNALGVNLYNIGVNLHKNNDQSCLQYFYNLIKFFIRFESRCDAKTVLKLSIISSSFLVVCSYNDKDYKKCMAFSALGIRLCPDQRTSLISNWIRAKASQRDIGSKEIQTITLVSAFEQFKKDMGMLTDGVNLLNRDDKIALLVFEIEQYKIKWKSKVPMMSVLKELCEIADLDRIVRVITAVFGDCGMMLHDDVRKIIQETLKRYKDSINEQENARPDSLAMLAMLYYMNYKYCVKDIIKKNTSDMERTVFPAQKTPDNIRKDPNDECDIVSSFDSLKLDRYFTVMKYLNKSLSLLASVITDDFAPSKFESIEQSTLYNLLLHISFEYRLHQYRVKSIQALQLALKVANSSCDIVRVISFIIETSDPKKNYVKYLMSIADEQLKNIERASIANIKIILTYYICKAKCLLYQNYNEAYKLFQAANELYEVQEDKSELKIILSQLHLLHFKFVLMPCEMGIVDHRKSTLLTVHLANAAIYEVYNTSKLDGAYEMSLLLDSNEELVKLHYFLRCPREVRSYCKETTILAQQLVLPIRCAYYLVYLAHADLRTSRYDDCLVKIAGLSDILCLMKQNLQIDQENKPPLCTAGVEKDIADITGDLREMVLDLPVPKGYQRQFSPSSPTLVVPSFYVPSFVQHAECDCFYCISLEYQNLVLEKTRLDAMINVKQKNVVLASDFFRGALRFYEACLKKYKSYHETMTSFVSYDLIPDFTEELLEAYGFTLLDYSYHLIRTKDKNEALKVTNKLIDFILPRKLQHIYLYNEALLQKLGYLTDIPPLPIKTEPDVLEIETLCPEYNIIATTPDSKQSKVTCLLKCTPNFSPPKRRVRKCLPFKLSPHPDGKAEEKTSPNLKQSKTPACKIKIYSSGSTTKKIKTTTDGGRRTGKKVLIHDDSSQSTSMGTPVVLGPMNCESGLKTKTKLLTERLRQSTKKPATGEGENTGRNEVLNDKPLSSRRNLFDEGLSEILSNTPRNTVRKSTRTRKI